MSFDYAWQATSRSESVSVQRRCNHLHGILSTTFAFKVQNQTVYIIFSGVGSVLFGNKTDLQIDLANRGA